MRARHSFISLAVSAPLLEQCQAHGRDFRSIWAETHCLSSKDTHLPAGFQTHIRKFGSKPASFSKLFLAALPQQLANL